MPELVIKDLIKVYGSGISEVIALRGLTMRVSHGELVAIKGPSGCGKTTLLNLVGGIDRPTAGRIELNGANIVEYNDAALVRHRLLQIGFVFQFFNLIPTLTAKENIELPMRLAKTHPRLRERRSFELLDIVGLRDRAGHTVDQLSGGEQQRIALAVAIANDPPLLLADEPTGELDSRTGQKTLDTFKVLNRDLDKTVIIVTHDERVSGIARRTLTIEDGEIIKDT